MVKENLQFAIGFRFSPIGIQRGYGKDIESVDWVSAKERNKRCSGIAKIKEMIKWPRV